MSKKRRHRAREKACEYAAMVLYGQGDTKPAVPMAWSLAVFFERYMLGGASATRRDFGPKKPAKLRPVVKS